MILRNLHEICMLSCQENEENDKSRSHFSYHLLEMIRKKIRSVVMGSNKCEISSDDEILNLL